MRSLRITGLGPLTVTVEGSPLRLGGLQQRKVLAYLALRVNSMVTTDAISAALWPSDPPPRPSAVIQVYISNIRRLLAAQNSMDEPKRSRLQTQPGGYLLALQADELDVTRLRDLANKGRAAVEREDWASAADLLGRAWLLSASSLMTSSAFPDLAEVADLQPEVAAVEEECLDAAQEWIETELALGRPQNVVREVQHLVERQPFRERLWASLITSLYQSRRQSDALAACQAVKRLFADELGIDPGQRITQLELAVLRQDESLELVDLSEVRRPKRRIANVPSPMTALVGRDRNVMDVLSLLVADSIRLVTITGPGGMGKTRLAMAVANRMSVGSHVEAKTTLADGVCWVELANLTNSDQVIGAVGHALGVVEQPRVALQDVVIEFLSQRQLLLVLDNFEHLVEAGTVVADLLAALPHLTILTTSRRPLHVRGETVFLLGGLDVPSLRIAGASDPSRPSAAAVTQAADASAVQLFLQRGGEVRPGYALSAENLKTVVEICHRLGGLPLAIELAAAQLRYQSERDLLAGWLSSTESRSSSPIDLPARQRTLGATIMWSYNLLTPVERDYFDQLSVFAGIPTLDAAMRVCSSRLGDGNAALQAITDHSMAGRQFDSLGECRLNMLQPIREFGHGQLARREDQEEIRLRHAKFYLELAERHSPSLFGSDQAYALARLNSDRLEIIAAFRWAANKESTKKLAVRFVAALWHFWELSSDVNIPCEIAELALAGGENETDALTVARAVSGLGTLQWLQGRTDRASQQHRLALDRFERLGDGEGIAWSRMCLAVQAMADGDPGQARRLALKAQETEGAGPRSIIGTSILLGLLTLYAGDLDSAKDYCAEAVAFARPHGDRWMLGSALINLGEVSEQLGDFDAAERCVREALTISQDLSAHILGSSCIENLASIQLHRGRPHSAARLFAASDAYRAEMALRTSPPEQERLNAIIARANTELGQIPFAVAWASGRALSITQAVEEALST